MSTPQLPQFPHPARRLRASKLTALMLALTCGALGSGSAQTATPAQATAAEAVSVPMSPALKAKLEVAHKLLSAKDYKKALAAYQQAVALDYRSFDAHLGLGLALFSQNDLLGSRFEFSQLVALSPDRIEGYFNLGVVQARAGDRTGAITSLGKAAEVGRGKVLPLVQIGTLRALAAQQIAGGSYAEAAKSLKEALDLEPADASLTLSLAETLYRSTKSTGESKDGAASTPAGDPTTLSDALAYAYKVQGQSPGNLQATGLIADIYVDQKLVPRALTELNRGVKQNGNKLEKAKLLFKKAQILQAAGRRQEAIPTLADAVKLDPSSGVAQYQYGRLLLEAQQTDQALTALKVAAKQNPKSAEVSLALAFAFDAKNNPAEAYRAAVATTKLTSDPTLIGSANLLAGKAAYVSKQYGIAKRLLVGASSGEALTWLGLTNYALKDYAGAVTALEGATKALPTNAVVQANLGASYLAAKRFSQAQSVLEGLVKRNPGYSEAWYNLGWAFRNLDRAPEAQSAFKKAFNLGYAPARKELGAK